MGMHILLLHEMHDGQYVCALCSNPAGLGKSKMVGADMEQNYAQLMLPKRNVCKKITILAKGFYY